MKTMSEIAEILNRPLPNVKISRKKLQWEKFWTYLLREASDHDAWWLDSWLEGRLEEFVEMHQEELQEIFE